MKVLMVNKFYYIQGGSETYYFALKKLLETNGHEVIDFSMKDDKNFPSSYDSYFVENIDYNGSSSVFSKWKAARNIIYSKEAKCNLERLILDTKPDIIHLNIFQHQLSPSILDVIKKYNIPNVYTAHDLKMLCLNYKMLTHGRICEACRGSKYIECFRNKCVKDSYAKSFINVMEGYIHKWRKSYDVIDLIITPSAFYRKKFIEFGIKPERVVHIPNFLDTEKPEINRRDDSGQYYLYFGRLSEEKGIMTLISAVENTDLTLYIVGTGPLMDKVVKRIESSGLKNIQYLGFKSGQELKDIVGNAKAVVLPSEWYENGPYSAIEALQLGRPIIGADIGGIPELINGNGMVFKSGDAENLQEILRRFNNLSKEEWNKISITSEKMFENSYTANSYFNAIHDLYWEIMTLKKNW